MTVNCRVVRLGLQSRLMVRLRLQTSLWLGTVYDSPTAPRFNCDTITYCDRTHASMAPLSNCKHSIQSLAQMKRPGGMREANNNCIYIAIHTATYMDIWLYTWLYVWLSAYGYMRICYRVAQALAHEIGRKSAECVSGTRF